MYHYHHLDNFIWFLLVGGMAGWMASVLVQGGGMGIIADIVVGIFGAFMGGCLMDFFGVYVWGFWGGLFMWVLGSVVFIVMFRGMEKMLSGK